MNALALAASTIILLVLRQNILIILMAVGLAVHFIWGSANASFFVQDMWAAIDKDAILALPLFIMVGEMMSRGSVAKRLINVMEQITRPLPGGLGIATVGSCAVFSAISGSSIVTLMAVGSVMYPALIARNYSRSFTIGALASAGTLGMLIPPSVPMILYGVVTETSIVDLFLAGIGPGILIVVVFSIYSMAIHWRLPRESWVFSDLINSLKDGIWSLMLPVLLLGGIYSGYFYPTEAAAFALLYCILIEAFIHRELSLDVVREVLFSSARLVGMLFPLIAVAISLNLLATENRIQQQLIDFAIGFIDTPLAFMLIVNLLLLLVGCLIDPASAILVLGPLLSPLAQTYGFDKVQFGIVMILNLEIGFLTPPLGMNLIVAVAAFKEPFLVVTRAVIPFIIMMLGCLLLVILFPEIAMWLVGR